MRHFLHRGLFVLALWTAGLAGWGEPLLAPDDQKYTERDAQRMIETAKGRLAAVYAPLAEQIVKDYGLSEKEGIGIDLGSGPGNLIIELCKRTRLHWVNADINPHFFPHFIKTAEAAGYGHRVSAIFADAHALPFRDGYADIIVSRGCFHFWDDKPRAFKEVYRTLKPGGVAFIGRGFPRTMPPEEAQRIRDAQKQEDGFPKYDLAQTESELRGAMKAAGIADFRISIPKPPGASDVSYGIWLEFRKAQMERR